ncbi:MAG: PrsW family intramembrane metalloprotease [Candidatus Aminicenantes bacterium]|nr:PrsW family intramembrane metalloprotease [Candidatus Aminicenantes bacterium]
MLLLVKIVVSLLPVFAFLIILFFLDSYKLVKLRSILFAIFIGSLVAGGCLVLNKFLLSHFTIDLKIFRRYVAPIVEEFLKAVYLVYLLKKKRVGFMVDATIFGFSIGAGFAALENIHYLFALSDSNLLLWIIRGFGTAILHGGSTAFVGLITKNLIDRKKNEKFFHYLPGIGMAIIIHSVFNHFIIHPLLSTILILFTLPVIIIFVFERSERSLQKWLDVGFISDVELLQMIRSGTVLKSRIGKYLLSLKKTVSGDILADMLCYLQIYVELALKAKGILLMHEAGFKPTPEEETMHMLKELRQLELNIGKTGKRILAPFIQVKSQDLWQIHMLGGYNSPGRKIPFFKKHNKRIS